MTLLKVEIVTFGRKISVIVEVGNAFLSLVEILEKSSSVDTYEVFNLRTMTYTEPAHYGYGDCPKWDLRRKERTS